MTGVSDLKLVHYSVLKTFFELNENFEFKQGKIDIHPNFDRQVKKIDDDHYQIKLSVTISSNEPKQNIPFNTEVAIVAAFELAEWESSPANQIAVASATAIMFPYLRTLLSTVTMNGNVPPYILPVMNINKLFTSESK